MIANTYYHFLLSEEGIGGAQRLLAKATHPEGASWEIIPGVVGAAAVQRGTDDSIYILELRSEDL